MLSRPQWEALPLVGALILAGCGSFIPGKGKKSAQNAAPKATAQDPSADAKTDAVEEEATARLEVLAPGELARKIYDAFGPEMTVIQQGQRTIDYLDANSTSFIGSISTDPNNKYATEFSIGYFLALAGVADVVGQNYSVQVYSNRALHDCRKVDGAEAILRAIAPTIKESEIADFAGDLVAACQVDPHSAASATVQSFSTALKATW